MPPEASACAHCGCAESVTEPLSPKLARKIILGVLATGAVAGYAFLSPSTPTVTPVYAAPMDPRASTNPDVHDATAASDAPYDARVEGSPAGRDAGLD